MARDVFITGGTGSVGSELVEQFTDDGHEVVFQYRSNDELAETLESETEAESWQCDFTDDFQLPDRDFDVVVNSAGVLLTKTKTENVPLNNWQKAVKINLTVPFQIIKKYLPAMVEQNWGRIVNIGSIYSLTATKNNSSYNASKHGLSGLTKSVAKEYAADGITCNEICPAAIESEIMDEVARQKEADGVMSASEYLDQVREANPAGRMVVPEDIGSVVCFLASEKAEFINGESIVIDGGQIC